MLKATHVSAAFPWIKLAIFGCALFFYTSGVYAGKADHSREHSVKNFSCWTGEPPKARHLREEPLENSGVLETAGEKAVILEYESYIVFNHTDTALMTCLKDREESDAEVLVKVFETTEKDEDSDEDNDPLSAGDEIGFQWFFRHLADLFLKKNLFGEAAPDSKDDYPDAPSAPYSPFGGDMLEGSLIPDFKELTIKPKAWSMPGENIELIVSKKKVPDRPEKMFRGFRARHTLQSGIIVEVGPDSLWIPELGLPEEDKLTRALRRVIECDVGRRRCSEVNTGLRQLQALENVLIELSVAGEPVVPALNINLEDLPWLTYQQLERLSGRIRAYLNNIDPQTLDEMSLENHSIPFRTALLQIIDQISEAHSALLQSRKTGLSNDLGRVQRDLSMVLSANINGQLAMMNRAVSERDARIYEMLIESIRQLKVETEIEEKNQELKAEIRKWEEIQSMPEGERRAETVTELKKRMAEITSRLNMLGLEQARLSGTLDNILSVIPPAHSVESGASGMEEPTDVDKDESKSKKFNKGGASGRDQHTEASDEESEGEDDQQTEDGTSREGRDGGDREDEEKKRKNLKEKKDKALKVESNELSVFDKAYLQDVFEELANAVDNNDAPFLIEERKRIRRHLGEDVEEHVSERVSQVLSLPPYETGSDEAYSELRQKEFKDILLLAWRKGRIMLVVEFLSEVVTSEQVSEHRKYRNRRIRPAYSQPPTALNGSGWEIHFEHDGRRVSEPAVIRALEQIGFIQLLTRNGGLIAPSLEERDYYRRQYYSDGERINSQVRIFQLAPIEGLQGLGRSVEGFYVVFDAHKQKTFLARYGIEGGGEKTEGLNEVAVRLPQHLLPSDPDFEFILHALMTQNTGTQAHQIIFGGELEGQQITGLLESQLGSRLIGQAGSVPGCTNCYTLQYRVSLVGEHGVEYVDVEIIHDYRKWQDRSERGTLSFHDGSIEVRQRFRFEKRPEGWFLIGKSLHYVGHSDLELREQQEKAERKKITDAKSRKADAKFDAFVYMEHIREVKTKLGDAVALLQRMDMNRVHSEEETRQAKLKFTEIIKKINLAYNTLNTLNGDERETKLNEVFGLWSEWKELYVSLTGILEHWLLTTDYGKAQFKINDFQRRQRLNGIFDEYMEVLSRLIKVEKKARDVVERVDAVESLNREEHASLNTLMAEYEKILEEANKIIKEAREGDSPLQVKLKALRPEPEPESGKVPDAEAAAYAEEQEELQRISRHYMLLQKAIQMNRDLLLGRVTQLGRALQARKMSDQNLHSGSRSEEVGNKFIIHGIDRGIFIDGGSSGVSSETSSISSRIHSVDFQTRRHSTRVIPIRQRTSSLNSLFWVKPSKESDGEPKKGKQRSNSSERSHPVSSDNSSTSNKLAKILLVLKSEEQENTCSQFSQYKRGLISSRRICLQESSRGSSQSDGLSLDPGETSLDYQDSGLGLRSTASSNARSLESSRSSSFSNQPGSLPSGSDSMVVDGSRSPSENGVLEELAPRRRRMQALSTVFSEEGDNPPFESDLDALFSRAGYREGSSVTLNEDAQLSRSLDDLNALRSPGGRRPTTSGSGRSITEELTEQWDELLASQTPTGSGSPSRRNVKAEIEEIIRDTVTPLSQPTMILTRSLYRVVVRDGNISALATSLDPSEESITGWDEMDSDVQLELLSELLIEFLQDGTGDSLAGTIDRLYGESFVEEYRNQISEGLSGSAQ